MVSRHWFHDENINNFHKNVLNVIKSQFKLWLSFYPIGCVNFTRHCGKMYSRHLFSYGRLRDHTTEVSRKWFIAVVATFKAVVSRRSILKYRNCAKKLNFDFVFRYFKPKKNSDIFLKSKRITYHSSLCNLGSPFASFEQPLCVMWANGYKLMSSK